MQRKIGFYYLIGLSELLVKAPQILVQSTALSYARYMFYNENGIEIDETNYLKLFKSPRDFEKQYGMNHKEILSKYDYQKYLEQIQTQQQCNLNITGSDKKEDTIKNEPKMLRIAKEDFVKKIIALKKQQDKQIANLEAQKKKEGVDIGE